MTLVTVVPLVLAVGVAAVVTATHRRLPPALASRVLLVAFGAVAVAAAATLWVVSLDFLAHVPIVGQALHNALGEVGIHIPEPDFHQRIPTWVGLTAVAVSLVGVCRSWAIVRRYRRLRHDWEAPIEVADCEEPFAVTLPGRAGHVMVSRGLMELLEEDELAVVFAHEDAHRRHRHDRFLLAGQLGTVIVPPLGLLARRLRFSLERWADEDAARGCGDRRLVGHTLAKVALGTVTPATGLAFAGLGAPGRVAALLEPPTAPSRVVVGGIFLMIATTCVLALVQLHHLETLVRALCPS